MLRLTITLLFSCCLSLCLAQTGKVKNLAVFFAVKDYKNTQNWASLNQPINDAQAIAAVLNKDYGFDTLIIRNPTLQQIEVKITQLTQQQYEEDAHLLVFFSGHGFYNATYKEGYFVPKDGNREITGCLTYSLLAKMIDAIPCKHILTVGDACYAGTFEGNKNKTRPVGWDEAGVEKQDKIKLLLQEKTRRFLPSVDNNVTPDDSKFARALIASLKNPHKDGILNLDLLKGNLVAELPRLKDIDLKTFGKDKGGDFLFIQREAQKAPDQDGDGIADKDDLCPAEKGLSRFDGCPDSDGDEISDKGDKCPKLKGLARFGGCPDSDGDGFPEGLTPPADECENEYGTLQGCLDSDNDGVLDYKDSCKYIAGSLPTGCPQRNIPPTPPIIINVEEKYQEALKSAQEYVQLANDEFEEMNCLAEKGHWENAKKSYQKCLTYKPNDQTAKDGIKSCEQELAKTCDRDNDGFSDEVDKCPRLAGVAPDGCPKEVFPPPSMIYVEGNSSIKSFYIGETEITIGQYLQFCNATNSHYPEWLQAGNSYNIKTGSDAYYKHKGISESAVSLPIVGVSWYDAVAYCDWLKTKTGDNYRLPTEAEWKYAAKGGNKSKGYEYAGSNNIEEVAWYGESSYYKPHNVKGKNKNELGLYDMSGNVWEWCNDWYDTEQEYKVVRGGAWDSDPYSSRVSFRLNAFPTSSGLNLGFRVVR